MPVCGAPDSVPERNRRSSLRLPCGPPVSPIISVHQAAITVGAVARHHAAMPRCRDAEEARPCSCAIDAIGSTR